MEKKIKHLEFIQNIIGRQAKNSFILKGWVITLIAALFAFAPRDSTFKPIFSVYALILIFWILDSYYLWQERLFRALFERVRKLKEEEIDFNMNVGGFSKQIKCSWWDVAVSHTLSIFYFSLMIFTVVFFSWK